MGLFSKKDCAICGGKAGMLSRSGIADGLYICGDCRNKCCPALGGAALKRMSADDVRRNMRLMEENYARYQSEFQETRRFCTGQRRDKPVFSADETHGWWVVPTQTRPTVYNLDDITNYNLRLNTTPLSEKEREKENNQGLLAFLFSPSLYNSYPELPRCPSGEKITGMRFNIEFRANELGAESVELDMFPGFFTDENDARAAFDCSHELYQFLKEWRNAQPVTRPAASASGGVTADMTESLKNLQELLQTGVLTQEEFDAKKRQILGL